MTYALIENGKIIEYPVYQGDIFLKYPHISFTLPFTPPEGYELVHETPTPEVDYTKNVIEGEPQLEDEKWIRTWKIVDASPEEVLERVNYKSQQVREIRNRFLSQTDGLIIKSLETGSKVATELTIYRQALRDIPQQSGFPWEIEWPELE